MKAITDRCELLEFFMRHVAKKVESEEDDKRLGQWAYDTIQEIRAISELLPDQFQVMAAAQIPENLRRPPERIIDLPGK
jgi:hypothetical protein